MSFHRVAIAAAGTALVAFLGIMADGRRNTAWAEDSSLCLEPTGTLCRTVQVQICHQYELTSITAGLTGGGLGSTCKMWITTTYYYYYTGSGGTTTKAGLK